MSGRVAEVGERTMQFLISAEAKGGKVGVDYPIWVKPPVRRLLYDNPCQCKEIYPVTDESWQQFKRDFPHLAKSAGHFICACHGRLIE